MGYNKFQEARLGAGLCLRCGAERGEGSTKLNCAECAAKLRAHTRAYRERNPEKANAYNKEVRKAWREKRRADLQAVGRCLRCGGDRGGGTGALCLTCQQKQNGWGADFRQRERNKAVGGAYDVPPWPMGAALPRLEGGGHNRRLGLTIPARIALGRILDRYREDERAAGRTPKTHQLIRLVRETIRKWRRSPCPRDPEGDVWIVETVNITLDAPCLQIVRHQTVSYFDGNESAALRALLVHGAPRPTRVIGATARYRSR
jgi:hypothetical protein